MKLLRQLTVLVMLLCIPVALLAAEADADFENESNFDAYCAGNGKIHVKVLIFSERGYDHNAGRGNNQSLGNEPDATPHATGSRVHTKLVSNNASAIHLHYWADNYYNNTGSAGSHKWPKDKGVVWVQLWSGVIECTNTYDGIKRTVIADGTVQQIELKRKDEGNHLTWFEFDWYPPEDLDAQDFRLYITTDHHKWNQSSFKTKTYDFDLFTGADSDQAPILSDPFFYPINQNGEAAAFGKLAYSYVCMQDVYMYRTSLSPTTYSLTEKSGLMYVDAQDTVQHGFRACFYLLRSTDNTTKHWMWSNRVDVPAFHKPRNFRAKGYTYYHAELDRWYADYRYKSLTWEIHYPEENDAVAGDMFELQRAYKSDFSDAETIQMIPMVYDSTTTVNNIQTYTYVDSTEAAWWNPVEKSYNIYYRIRRASTATWNWDVNPAAATVTATVARDKQYIIQNFATLMSYLYSYEKAPDFDTSREVIFNWRLYNSIRGSFTQNDPGYLTRYIDPKQKLMLRKILMERNDTLLIEIPQDSIIKAVNAAKYSTDHNYIYGHYNIQLYYTDHAYTPCTNYKYETYIDTTGIIVKDLTDYESYTLPTHVMDGPTLYYTDVASIEGLTGTQKEHSEFVLLSWDLTDGDVGTYSVYTRPNTSVDWTLLADGLTDNWYKDTQADPTVTDTWLYLLVMTYECNGTTKRYTQETTGSRNPYGKIRGRVVYGDGTGCADIEVNVSRVSDGTVVQRVRTDENGYYMLDSVLYCGDAQYAVMPVNQTAEFRYNSTSANFAPVTLSLDHAVAQDINFENISSVRVSGRLLYENTTIPVRDASFLVNGVPVKRNGSLSRTDASGNFEFMAPKGAPFTLQAYKAGHTFAGEGYVRMDGDSLLTLSKPLDGVRIYDQTKVRLIGRITGGNNQASKPLGFGLSTNNLGEDLKMVFELEGDNISQIVHVPSDLTIDHIYDTVGATTTQLLKKRIIINPDVETGEYAVDLFPVRYKITQVTARGYSTLFAEGKTTETLDLSEAADTHLTSEYKGQTVNYNASYSITYHSPISLTCKQLRYGMEVDYFGEQNMLRQAITNKRVSIPLAEKQPDGTYKYLFGAPVFNMGNYDFRITAHEDYYYNNDPTSVKHEEVRLKGGALKVYNGLHDAANTQRQTTYLDDNGETLISIPVDYVSFRKTGEDALRVLDLSLEYQGMYVESQPIRAYVAGNKAKGRDFVTSVKADVTLLDILRDPPGANSFAYIEKGTTYKYNYSWDFSLEFGIVINATYGSQNTLTLGTFAGAPAGPGLYTGYVMSNQIANSFSLPISASVFYKNAASYSFTTNERIETGKDYWHVGSKADIYIGTTQSVYFGLTDAVKPIDSLTFASLSARLIDNMGDEGTMRVVAEGRSDNGQKYYFVIGQEMEAGAYVDGSFAYTTDYIFNTLIPKLLAERNALLICGDSATVQQIADNRKEMVYWSKVPPEADTYALSDYKKLYPNGVSNKWLEIDDVDLYNKQILKWVDLIRKNEEEKIQLQKGTNCDVVQTYAISDGAKQSYSETYEHSNTVTYYWNYPGVSPTANIQLKSFAKYMDKASSTFTNQLATLTGQQPGNNQQAGGEQGANQQQQQNKEPTTITTDMPAATWKFSLNPIFDMDFNRDPSNTTSKKKTAGFTLDTDQFSYMNVTVSRLREKKNDFNTGSESDRDLVDNGNDFDKDDYLYGSFVYTLNGGASKCPWEGPEESIFYEQNGQPVLLSPGTLRLENPKLDIDVHERSDIPHDQPARFNLKLSNEMEQTLGTPGITFQLKLYEPSNPHGAKVYVDGMPLTGDGRDIKIHTGMIINKTMEVYAGEGYDYEDITVQLKSSCDTEIYSRATFSVHYLPVSCPVNLSAPHDSWVQNTLSPQDSIGWYMPVVIDGFDVNYKEFDHIEFQYKLSTQSDDAWVNQCSYYANDSLYALASGNKAMISGGRIDNIRFYGERDPMEQKYDLRAVSFCRHGNGFISRSSKVLTGIKDTRPPRVFGQPEPANSILGVGNNLTLRFNEPIAGNYLDEDNNFQLLGVTNEVGLTTGASLAFDGTPGSYADTKASRSLANKSFSIDMMVKPENTNLDDIFFMHGSGDDLLLFGKTYNNRLVLHVGSNSFFSLPLEQPMTAFTRVVVTYNHESKAVRFYAGTQELTDNTAAPATFEHNIPSPFVFGMGYAGNILEARIWTKALTPAEVANTANHALTGYEQELLAYYPMNEGTGETLNDKANGATLFTHSTTWALEKGISLHIPATDSIDLAGDLLARSAIQDETLMLWFKTTSSNGSIFSAASGFRLAIENGDLVMYSNNQKFEITNSQCSDGSWHHISLTVNRAFNNASLFLDNRMVQTVDAIKFGSISGRMILGGGGFEGNIDDLAVYEQALPKILLEEFGTLSPFGDEMGLMAYLPFEEAKENENGIIEIVFSPNDRRQFKSGGQVINKVVPLIAENQIAKAESMADKVEHAPVHSHGQLAKLHFDWSFNGDELMINVLNDDREVNKQSIYITVRDVEDLNGNPMASPVTWTAFVDRNSLKWEDDDLDLYHIYGMTISYNSSDMQIVNLSGKRHQYTIESLPDWLTVDKPYGSIDPMQDKVIRFYYNTDMPAGEYMDIVYLTDENGLSEPLEVEYHVEAYPPYEEVDKGKYSLNMSICGKVMIHTADGSTVYDTDPNDRVYALYRNECVGMAHVAFDPATNNSELFLTVYGSEEMTRKEVNFQLWQASTGKVFNLNPSSKITFTHGFVYGCGDDQPIVFTTSGSETQNIDLSTGWNWISTYLSISDNGLSVTGQQPWTEGDLIKNPANRQFSTYSEQSDAFVGTLGGWDYKQIYMMYAARGNTLRLNGDKLSEAGKQITLRGDGLWNVLPCLFDRITPLAEALTDYYDHASAGDIIKSHDHFAVFSTDKHWKGDLTALRPGEGYLFRRLGNGSVNLRFYNRSSNAPRRSSSVSDSGLSGEATQYTNTNAATNMTMIAAVEGEGLKAYIGEQLVGVASPVTVDNQVLYFLTVQSDSHGELRFTTADDQPLTVVGETIRYAADSHAGTLNAPVQLVAGDNRPCKIIENDHVVIIRNGERYDVTGVRLNETR